VFIPSPGLSPPFRHLLFEFVDLLNLIVCVLAFFFPGQQECIVVRRQLLRVAVLKLFQMLQFFVCPDLLYFLYPDDRVAVGIDRLDKVVQALLDPLLPLCVFRILERVQQAEMQVQEATPAFTTLQNATVPIKNKGPRKKVIVLTFLFLAFLATSVWVLHKENDLKPLLGLN
jgi:hypothetical protein